MRKKSAFASALLLFAACLLPSALALTTNLIIAQAQPIMPADDGTGTQVTPKGNQLNIHGGQLSGDEANLFHSFEKFNLSEGQIANFLSNPNIRNIIGAVTGGEASIINGLIQVTGGNSNLFLLNPAGIIFGPNASLNVPGAFIPTTASGIRFGRQNWFNVEGDNNWSELVGNPDFLRFNSRSRESFLQQGIISVREGEALIIETPRGAIELQKVTGENLVRITAKGSKLSLEIPLSDFYYSDSDSDSDSSIRRPQQSLPELLTGGRVNRHADKVRVNENGQIALTGSGISGRRESLAVREVEPRRVPVIMSEFPKNSKLPTSNSQELPRRDAISDQFNHAGTRLSEIPKPSSAEMSSRPTNINNVDRSARQINREPITSIAEMGESDYLLRPDRSINDLLHPGQQYERGDRHQEGASLGISRLPEIRDRQINIPQLDRHPRQKNQQSLPFSPESLSVEPVTDLINRNANGRNNNQAATGELIATPIIFPEFNSFVYPNTVNNLGEFFNKFNRENVPVTADRGISLPNESLPNSPVNNGTASLQGQSELIVSMIPEIFESGREDIVFSDGIQVTIVENIDTSSSQFNEEGRSIGAEELPSLPINCRRQCFAPTKERASVRDSGNNAIASQIEVRVSGPEISNRLNISNPEIGILEIEGLWSNKFMNYFRENIPEIKTYTSIKEMLGKIEEQTGNKPAIVYAIASQEQLTMMAVLPEKNIVKSVPVTQKELLRTAKEFRTFVSNPRNNFYKQPAQQLYNWLIEPIESQLQAEGINTLMFSLDAGLRSLPLAALHDGQKFLVEKYSISLIPSVSLTDASYTGLENTQLLAMGASEFTNQQPLPAVPVELAAIASIWRKDKTYFLNQEFTLTNLKAQRQQHQIVHLATHADFRNSEDSFIQLWDTKLKLEQLRELKWHETPTVELLVLSACRTAIGDEETELGFAGLAVQAGVKSVLASLWLVSDAGTLRLMTEFYQHLLGQPGGINPRQPIKATALQQAQIAMIAGEVHPGYQKEALPPELARRLGNENIDLSHPSYWAGFTLIGSPW